MDFDKVRTIIRNIGRLPRSLECDIGKISLLSEIEELGAIIVSSDNKVLEAYTFVERKIHALHFLCNTNRTRIQAMTSASRSRKISNCINITAVPIRTTNIDIGHNLFGFIPF
jgi:hypothetical protein